MKQNNMLAMILAGGRGSRLHELTNKVAKPAVFYGGKYRIIDFPLSNCANSGIDVVGVLTQYESVLLNSYVAAGRRWGLDAKESGVYVLPPREKADANLDVYRGTADAISQNIDFIDSYSPEYLLILSGDHIYKMNYAKMLAYHQECNADATIAVIEVPLREASRFGIMNADETNRIYEFEEKPEKPKSNLASMGIYIFNWKALRKLLVEDIKNPDSHHDFGKDIIPTMLGEGKRLFAYKFKGYWKDVGTIDSLWDDRAERSIEALCMRLLLRQQPVATDLRNISAALKMISDLERVGDYAMDIVELSPYLSAAQLSGKAHLAEMALAAVDMVKQSVQAFVDGDVQLAARVKEQDDKVDELFDKVKEEAVELIRTGSLEAHAALDLGMAAKYFERIGDHAVNVAEWVTYAHTGEKK